MPTQEALAKLAGPLASVKAKYGGDLHKTITSEELLAVNELLGYAFIDCMIVKAGPWSAGYMTREGGGLTQVYFTIIDESGEYYQRAMLWLHHLLHESGATRMFRNMLKKETRSATEVMHDELMKRFDQGQFQRHKVIRITKEGDELIVDNDDDATFDGKHRYCGGRVTRHRSTKLLDALHCDNCGLRITLDKNIEKVCDLAH